MPEGDNVPMSMIHKRQIIVKSVQFVGLIYIVYGIFVALTNVCINLDKKVFEYGQFTRFWDPVATIYSMANFSVFAMTIYYKYWNCQRGLSSLIARPADHMMASIIVLSFGFAVVDYVLEILRDIVIIPCHGYFSFLVPVSTLLLFIGVIVLIFDVGQNVPTTSNWKMNVMRTYSVFFTVIGISNSFIISISYQHMRIFKLDAQHEPDTFNDTFIYKDTCIWDNHIRSSMCKAFDFCDEYLRPTVSLFCICSFFYLVQPLLEKDDIANMIESQPSTIQSGFTTIESGEPQMEDSRLVQRTPSIRLSPGPLLLCIIFLSLSLLSLIITLSFKHTSNYLKFPASIITTILLIFIYILGSGLSMVHIEEICRWPCHSKKRGKIIEKCIIWIGAAGQLSFAMAAIVIVVELLNYPESTERVYTWRNILAIPKHLLQVWQIYLQTISLSLAIDRKWVPSKIESWAEFLCPPVGMMGLNFGLLLLGLIEIATPIIEEPMKLFFMDILLRGIYEIGGTLSILQRLHASILFANMILYTHN